MSDRVRLVVATAVSSSNSHDDIEVDSSNNNKSTTTSRSSTSNLDDGVLSPKYGNKKLRRLSSLSLASMMTRFHWKGRQEFLYAQLQVAVVLLIAFIGDRWPKSYPRNDNEDPRMFWVCNSCLLIAALVTLKREENGSARGIQLLSRPQTEEWKGWMQWAFILYHYYRVYSVYNEIRVFVSAYVWMTGFGNFLYFDKKQDFSIERMVSMWLRINYFPMLLCFALDVPMHEYYVVPLHTAGFFMTMATAYVAYVLRNGGMDRTKANVISMAVSLLAHVIFYETAVCNVLKFFGREYFVRFRIDKYSAWVGIVSGFFWSKFSEYMQWAYGTERGDRLIPMLTQRFAGIGLLAAWFYFWGYLPKAEKERYNAIHPYIFWMPVAGWLMIRNSSKFLTEIHSGVLEFFGQITLETYVLQFHVFMCRKVQHIPIVIPGSGKDGPLWLKTCNMLLCGVIFVSLALWARKLTISTQTTVTELVTVLRTGLSSQPPQPQQGDTMETESLVKDTASNNNSSANHAASKDLELTTKTSNLTASSTGGEMA